ncbi:MAG TPA: hypothetical protein VHM91_03320, partial [Verrucomicrobiales bacterium]|nr:hypothetical protein [Verrucomicrobiales bacterium]
MKRLLLLLPVFAFHAGRAAVVTTFDEASLPPEIQLDRPDKAVSDVVFDAVNDELDINATASTDMWVERANAAIAWTAIPAGLVNGSTWTAETEVRLNSVIENQQVAGLTFYGGPDGARPDITFGLDNWDPAARAVRFQGLGDNSPNVGVLTNADKVILRVVVKEGGATDTYNFFFRVNAADSWTQLGGAATNYQTNFGNSRVGMTYKTGGAKSGASFTYFRVVDDTTSAPYILTHPSSVATLAGTSAQFTVNAAGAASYQWRRDTQNITVGGNTATYTINPVVAGDNGASFDCVVTNPNGTATSNPAILTVTDPIIGGLHYSSAVQAEPSLVAYYPMDGSSGTAVANVKKPAFGGTLNGTMALDTTAARTVGAKSITASGAGWMSLVKDPELDFADGSGTIEMFAYQAATAGY